MEGSVDLQAEGAKPIVLYYRFVPFDVGADRSEAAEGGDIIDGAPPGVDRCRPGGGTLEHLSTASLYDYFGPCNRQIVCGVDIQTEGASSVERDERQAVVQNEGADADVAV